MTRNQNHGYASTIPPGQGDLFSVGVAHGE